MSTTLNAFSQNSKTRSYSVLSCSPSISSTYQLNKHVKQSGEFISIKCMFTLCWYDWLVRVTNYGRWCRW